LKSPQKAHRKMIVSRQWLHKLIKEEYSRALVEGRATVSRSLKEASGSGPYYAAKSFEELYEDLVDVLRTFRDEHAMDPERISKQASVTLHNEEQDEIGQEEVDVDDDYDPRPDNFEDYWKEHK